MCLLSLVSALGFFACQTPPDPVELTSLRRSGEATFLCLDKDLQGVPLSECPLGPRASDFGLTVGATGYSLHALVTQTLSSEVAVVRVAAGVDADGDAVGRVLDADMANPGVTPLRVGGAPTGIATTPGGAASFVGVSEAGLTGIYALPTKCILEPAKNEPARDRTSFPACSLPSAPVGLTVVVDPGDGGATERVSCGAPPPSDVPQADPDSSCLTDLSSEGGPKGRRKILVTFPERGTVALIDAQEVLSREPGTYEACHIELELPLDGTVPTGLEQTLPEDLAQPGGPSTITYDQIAGTYVPRPSWLDMLDGLVVIADRAAPLVHRLDARDPCHLTELLPLVATSYENPDRVVSTARVAISPRTLDGRQFVYAVDEEGDMHASVVMFDVSPSVTERTPILRAGSSLVPRQKPDRLEFPAGVKDVGFALVDRSISDPATGVATSGVYCDPDPRVSGSSPGGQVRPKSRTEGATPTTLRGLFAYVLLGNGNLAVVDIEDYDAACRRPVGANHTNEMDFRGCRGDEIRADYYTVNGASGSRPTVTDEVSCRAVLPHRPRSSSFLVTDETVGIRAPSLRSFGQLQQYSRGLTVSRLTTEGKRRPILLGVDFEAPGGGSVPAQVYVGSTLWSRDSLTNELIIDANRAERVSVVLPYVEPRAYPFEELTNVTYEGSLGRNSETGILSDSQVTSDGSQIHLHDPDMNFCSLGLEDEELTAQRGVRQFDLTGGALERFVDRHTDYIQVTNLLYHETDPYWDGAGALCGEDADDPTGTGYDLCAAVFGIGDRDELAPARDFRVISSAAKHLEIRPRMESSLTRDHQALLRCCFPDNISYRVRGGRQWIVRGAQSGFEHAIITDPSSDTLNCIFDESPGKARLAGRAFEISSTKCDETDAEQLDACGVGLRIEGDVVCSYDATRGPVELGGVASECIFSGLSRRFAIYRGLEETERDMSFAFEVTGGFNEMSVSLTKDSNVVLPVSMTTVPTFGGIGIVDSQNRGLMMVDIANSQVVQSFY